jgi:hypothetical protein
MSRVPGLGPGGAFAAPGGFANGALNLVSILGSSCMVGVSAIDFVRNHGPLIPATWKDREAVACRRKLSRVLYGLLFDLIIRCLITHQPNCQNALSFRGICFYHLKENLHR